jgi:hypothetical protein
MTDPGADEEPNPRPATPDPRRTDHPTGDQQARRNREDEGPA